MLEPRETEKLSPLAENSPPEIWRVLASGDRRAIVEAVLGNHTSLGSVDPKLARLVVSHSNIFLLILNLNLQTRPTTV